MRPLCPRRHPLLGPRLLGPARPQRRQHCRDRFQRGRDVLDCRHSLFRHDAGRRPAVGPRRRRVHVCPLCQRRHPLLGTKHVGRPGHRQHGDARRRRWRSEPAQLPRLFRARHGGHGRPRVLLRPLLGRHRALLGRQRQGPAGPGQHGQPRRRGRRNGHDRLCRPPGRPGPPDCLRRVVLLRRAEPRRDPLLGRQPVRRTGHAVARRRRLGARLDGRPECDRIHLPRGNLRSLARHDDGRGTRRRRRRHIRPRLAAEQPRDDYADGRPRVRRPRRQRAAHLCPGDLLGRADGHALGRRQQRARRLPLARPNHLHGRLDRQRLQRHRAAADCRPRRRRRGQRPGRPLRRLVLLLARERPHPLLGHRPERRPRIAGRHLRRRQRPANGQRGLHHLLGRNAGQRAQHRTLARVRHLCKRPHPLLGRGSERQARLRRPGPHWRRLRVHGRRQVSAILRPRHPHRRRRPLLLRHLHQRSHPLLGKRRQRRPRQQRGGRRRRRRRHRALPARLHRLFRYRPRNRPLGLGHVRLRILHQRPHPLLGQRQPRPAGH